MVASSRIYFWTKVKESADSVAKFTRQHPNPMPSVDFWASPSGEAMTAEIGRDESDCILSMDTGYREAWITGVADGFVLMGGRAKVRN
jgi:hypothetical protein